MNRSDTKQYGHRNIKDALGRISYYKCFYSEVKFATQVDHHMEVSEDKTKAFAWENLYFSHKDSNIGKPSNKALHNKDCLDPFTDLDTEIEQNLDFEDEIIKSVTPKGLNTISTNPFIMPCVQMNLKNSLKSRKRSHSTD